jgi:MOSC domain-containing protein YiiM
VTGHVVAIFVTPVESGATTRVEETRAVAGVGLEGDYRVALPDHPPDTQLTLVEREAIEAANAEHGLSLDLGDTRRNVVTEGVSLNHLVGREFTVGDVRARGVELCEPCAHLARLTGQPVVKALVHRGGLRAEILEGGTLRTGAPVHPL